jgi:mycothiol synthase
MLAVRTTPAAPAEVQARLDDAIDPLRHSFRDPFTILFGGGGVLANVAQLARIEGAERVQLEVFPADPGFDMLAAMAGFGLTRVLNQLRRPLPLWPPDPPLDPIELRAFRPGTDDEQAWLDVNNRAFAWHPEQSNWTLDDLHERMVEPWFDPEGFLLHERDGRLAAFCWTKVHEEETPPAGEIFVIGIDPDFQGLGIGGPLAYAGFDWLTARGLTQALLYCEADNDAAMRIYERMGFRVATTHRWYEQVLRTATPS